MKFIRKDGSIISFQDHFSLVNKDASPIKEIIARNDLSEFYYVNEDTISFKDIVQIQVNVIDVGVMIFLFKSASFDKETFIAEVSKLKEIQINSFYDVLTKMKSLYVVTEAFNPLCVIYVPSGKYIIYEDCFRTIVGNIITLYVTQEKQENNIEEGVVALKEKPVINKSDKTNNGKFNFKETFSQIVNIFKKEKFHFLFAFIATFLLGVTLAIGVFDAYAGKMICIFFFICSLAGSFLNFMIYKDTYKQGGFKTLFNVLTIFLSLIGIVGGFGVYMAFKAITKDVPAVMPNTLMIIGLMVLLYAISMSLPLLVIYIKEKKK